MSRPPQENQHQADSTSKPDQGRKPLPLATLWPEVGFEFKGSCDREECEGGSSSLRGSTNFDGGADGHMVCNEAFEESARELVRNDSTDCDVVLRGGADHGAAETECMELEEGSHAFTSC